MPRTSGVRGFCESDAVLRTVRSVTIKSQDVVCRHHLEKNLISNEAIRMKIKVFSSAKVAFPYFNNDCKTPKVTKTTQIKQTNKQSFPTPPQGNYFFFGLTSY